MKSLGEIISHLFIFPLSFFPHLMSREDDIPLSLSDADHNAGSDEQQSGTTRPEEEQPFSNDSADDDSLIEYLARLSPIPTDSTAIKEKQTATTRPTANRYLIF